MIQNIDQSISPFVLVAGTLVCLRAAVLELVSHFKDILLQTFALHKTSQNSGLYWHQISVLDLHPYFEYMLTAFTQRGIVSCAVIILCTGSKRQASALLWTLAVRLQIANNPWRCLMVLPCYCLSRGLAL
ncbi:uncharacterized protein BJ212DRAFT_1347772 [Suillus subaureus]|uniref:Uncharacterized protein n=1 Tax=Suillus subaureus TaxID=48587 RepID=A0A9P7JE45_9AGAM|nr:uncharacterized protein BJ212DRAFT_1347772 [Suillus subaureus]KAG1817941.1 hypothetical protein BJ212DRAFT_1347772 [Suillus subaureus]